MIIECIVRYSRFPETDINTSEIPMDVLLRDLALVLRDNQSPQKTKAEYLELLGLDSEITDGKVLAERFSQQGTFCSVIPMDIPNPRKAFAAVKLMKHMIQKFEYAVETPEQQTMAEILVAVATKQIEREKDICPVASQILIDFAEVRPEMVPMHAVEKARSVIETEFH